MAGRRNVRKGSEDGCIEAQRSVRNELRRSSVSAENVMNRDCK